MKFEKSCGAIVYRKTQNQIDLLLIKIAMEDTGPFQKDMWKGPKPRCRQHCGKSKRKTGLDISIQDGFRQAVEYFPKPNVRKQVVYFLGEAAERGFKMQEEEISRIIWTSIRKAYHMVTFKNDKNCFGGRENAFDRGPFRE